MEKKFSEEELDDILETFRYWEEEGNSQDSIFD